MSELFFSLLEILAILTVLVGAGAAGYGYYIYYLGKARHENLLMVQDLMDKKLLSLEGKFGTNLRSTLLLVDKSRLTPVLVRPEKAEEPEFNFIISENLARLASEKQVGWYASELQSGEAEAQDPDEQKHVRGVVAFPVKDASGKFIGVVTLESSTPFPLTLSSELEASMKQLAAAGAALK
ncbi:MAG: hypothetical protein M3348_13230 [Acidobacteriota bacterium]|nr:hypothetical protein [Acidobacteriota bacterium]